MTTHTGFIGLGIMGKPMARNLMAKGHALVVFNRSNAAMVELEREGAACASTPAEIGRLCQTILLMLPDGPDVEQVVCAKDGLLDTVGAGTLVIDMSSINPAISQRVAAQLATVGAGYIDAPVSGGEPGAIAGTLSIMCGGSADDIERARSILLDVGRSIVRIGEVGAGQAAKLVNQVLVALHLQAAAEALTLCRILGLDGITLLAAIRDGLAGSAVLNAKWQKMLSQEFSPGFKIRLHAKDLDNAVAAADAHDATLPWTSSVRRQFQRLMETGFGELDHSALVDALGSEGTSAPCLPATLAPPGSL